MMTSINKWLRDLFTKDEEMAKKTIKKGGSDSYYSKSKLIDNRTINYRFSVKTKKDQAYTDLMKVIAEHNKDQEVIESLGITPHYLRVRGRGRGPHRQGKVLYTQSIPDRFATHFDVYVVKDTDKAHAADARMAKAKVTLKKTAKLASVVTSRTLVPQAVAA